MGAWSCFGFRAGGARTALVVVLLLSSLALLSPGTALADPADVNWSSNFGAPGIEGNINAMTTWNGSVVVGGWLFHASGRPAHNVVLWNGSAFVPLGEGFDDEVRSLAVVGTTLYAAGAFTASGATPLPNVARWNGTAWVAVGSGPPDNTDNLRLGVDGASLLLLGSFYEVGSPPVAAQSIARWDGTTWSAVGDYAGGEQICAAARVGSLLYVAGNQLDAWDGTDWSYDLGSGTGANTLAVLGSDLFLGGEVYGNDPLNVPFNGVARFDGTELHALGGVDPDGQIAQVIIDEGQVCVVGSFANTPGPGVAYWDGTDWSPGPWGVLGAPGQVVRMGSDLFMAGHLSSFYDNVDNRFEGVANITAWNGSSWRALGPGSGVTDGGYVQGLTTWNNSLVAAGSFRRIGNLGDAGGIAAWNGTAWTRFGSGLDEAFNNPSGHYLTSWNNRVVVTGYFSGAGGGAVTSSNIAAWNGTSWEGFNGGFSGQNARVADFGGTLIAASGAGVLGTQYGGGGSLGHIARWTGTQWQTIGTLTPIYSLADFGMTVWNGSVVYAGSFSAVNGVPASNIALWNGTTWSALGAGFNNFVTSVTVHNGELYAGGFFTASGATPIPGRVARWNGSAWVAAGVGIDAAAIDMISAGGKLYVTGGIATAGGAPARKVASWDGTNWSPLGSGVGGGPQGNSGGGLCLGVLGDGLFVGGYFNTAGENSSRGLARWQLGVASGVAPVVADRGLFLAPPVQNPASGAARLSFRLESGSVVESAVFDAQGRRVRVLAAAMFEAGDHLLTWDGRDDAGRAVESGIYWVNVNTDRGRAARKLVWLR